MKITKKTLLFAIITPCWVIIAVVGLFFASKNAETLFDPTDALYLAANTPGFSLRVNSILSTALNASLSNVVVHISSKKNCLCQFNAKRHISSVKKAVTDIGKQNANVFIEEVAGLSDIVTSTPAIAVFDYEGELSYFGPYSTGIGCLSGNGSVEPFLDIKSPLGAIVPLESSGCYCAI